MCIWVQLSIFHIQACFKFHAALVCFVLLYTNDSLIKIIALGTIDSSTIIIMMMMHCMHIYFYVDFQVWARLSK